MFGLARRRLVTGAFATGVSLAAATVSASLAQEAPDSDAPAKAQKPGSWASWMGLAPPSEALSPDEWRPLKLSSIHWESHDVARLRFNFPNYWDISGMECASFLLTRAPIGKVKEDGSRGFVVRPYTPSHLNRGYLELHIKVYPEGKMSKYLGELRRGSTLDFKGPIMKIPIVENQFEEIGLIAGGTGITPMLQVAKRVLLNPNDKTKVSLLFANKTEGDIILREQLDELARQHPGRFKVQYVLDKPPEGWTGGSGYFTAEMLKEHLPSHESNAKVLVCGPPPMMELVSGQAEKKGQGELRGLLKEIGFVAEQVCKF